MSLEVGELFARLRLDSSAFNSGMSSARRGFEGMGSGLVGLATKFAGLIGVSLSAGMVTKMGIEYNAMMETSQAAWETILGNTKDATSTMKELVQFGAKTPFEFEGVDKAAKSLTMAGFKGKDLTKTLTSVGDAVAAVGGNDETLQGVSTALFQMSAKGKVSAEEMQQMAERGLPVWDLLAGKMHMSVAELMDMSQKGKLMAKDTVPLLVQAMGDRFGGAMDKQSKTFNGMMSTMKDNAKQLAGVLTQGLFNKIKVLLPPIIDLIGKMTSSIQKNGLGGAFAKMFPPSIANIITQVGGALKNAGTYIQAFFALMSGQGGKSYDLLQSMGLSPQQVLTVQQIMTSIINGINNGIAIVKQTFSSIAGFMGDQWGRIKQLFSGGNSLAQSFGSIFSTIKSIVMPILTDLIAFVKQEFGMIKKFWDENGAQIIAAIKVFWAIIAAIFKVLAPVILFVIKTVFNSIKGVIDGALKIIIGLIKIFAGLFTGDFGKMWEGVKQLFAGALKFIWNLVNLMAIGQILKGFKLMGQGIVIAVKGMVGLVKGLFTSFRSSISGLVSSAVHIVVTLFKSLWGSMVSIGKSIVSAMGGAFGAIKNLIVQAFVKSNEATKAGLMKVIGVFKGIGGKMAEIGKNLIMGLINGITGKVQALVDKVKAIGGSMLTVIKKVLGIKSPSKEMSAIGGFAIAGLVQGLNSGKAAVAKAAADIAKVTIPKFRGEIAISKTELANFNKVIARVNKLSQSQITAIQKQASADRKSILMNEVSRVNAIHAKAHDAHRKLTKAEQREITKILSNGANDRAGVSKKESADIKKIEGDLNSQRLQALTDYVNKRRDLGSMTLEQEVEYWKKATTTFKKGTDEQLQAAINYHNSLDQLNADSYAKAKGFIDDAVSHNKMSLMQELKAYEQVATQYKKGSKERADAEEQIYQLKQQIHQKLIDLDNEYMDKMKQVNDQMIQQEQSLNESYKQALDDRAKALYDSYGLFDEFQKDSDVSSDTLLQNLQSQVTGMKSWSNDLGALARRGVSDGLIKELEQMGPKSSAQIEALTNMTDAQLSQYQGLWAEKNATVRTQAESELEGMKLDTAAKINELHAQTALQLDALKLEWTTKIGEIINGTETSFTSMNQIGKDAISGLMAGMSDMTGPLMTKAKSIADAVQKAMKKALQIHSPSRVMRGIGQFTGQGFIDGISGMIGGVQVTASKLAKAAIPAIPSINTRSIAMSSIPSRGNILNIAYDRMKKAMDTIDGGNGGTTGPITVNVHADDLQQMSQVIDLFNGIRMGTRRK